MSTSIQETKTRCFSRHDLYICELVLLLLLLFNTTRARAQPPDPQAREPLSLWTEAWPTHNPASPSRVNQTTQDSLGRSVVFSKHNLSAHHRGALPPGHVLRGQ